MYDIRPNLVIGFHGCDIRVRDKLLNHPDEIVISQRPYDWLGHGMYFWENNYVRAMQWAEDKKQRGGIETPAVIGAVLHLGHCCDLTDSKFINEVTKAYRLMADERRILGKALPQNKDLPHDKHKNKLLRNRDCGTIEFMHEQIQTGYSNDIKRRGFSDLKLFDSTRGVFTEGGPAFEGSGIMTKTHTQICIRNFNCIQGFFLPRREINFLSHLQLIQPRLAA